MMYEMFPRNSRGRRHRNTQLMLIITLLHTLLTCLRKLEITIPPATRRPWPVLAVVVVLKFFFHYIYYYYYYYYYYY